MAIKYGDNFKEIHFINPSMMVGLKFQLLLLLTKKDF